MNIALIARTVRSKIDNAYKTVFGQLIDNYYIFLKALLWPISLNISIFASQTLRHLLIKREIEMIKCHACTTY